MAVITQEIIEKSWQYLAQQAYYYTRGDAGAIARYASNIIDEIGADAIDIPCNVSMEIKALFTCLSRNTNPEDDRGTMIPKIHKAIAENFDIDTSTTELAPGLPAFPDRDDPAPATPFGWDFV